MQHSEHFEEALAALVIMTAPMAPHLASELWAGKGLPAPVVLNWYLHWVFFYFFVNSIMKGKLPIKPLPNENMQSVFWFDKHFEINI